MTLRGSASMPHPLVWLVIAVLCTACSSYAVPRYGVAVTNVTALRQIGGQKTNVQPFTATGESKTEIGCRAVGPVKTPDGRPFEEYIRKALIDELHGRGLIHKDLKPANILVTRESSEAWRIGFGARDSHAPTVKADLGCPENTELRCPLFTDVRDP